ncbi:MAG TPA: energy transducer TonB [Xanthomonadaceae bacterium]|nr:energy transducer TonB [Xanthomonadaceae bacterium]
MVRSTTFQPHARQQPDPIRIVAISVSIALNATMIGLLMRPPEFTLPAPDAPQMQAQTIDTRPLTKPKDPVKIEKQHAKPIQATVQPIQHQKDVVVINHETTPVSIAADTNQKKDTTNQDKQDVSNQPVEASLTPIASPAPIYPRDALRDGITGTVELELLVGVDGSVLQVRITHSSGNRQLDNAAREQVLRNWRFQPALRGGIAVQALGRVPIVFSLDGR